MKWRFEFQIFEQPNQGGDGQAGSVPHASPETLQRRKNGRRRKRVAPNLRRRAEEVLQSLRRRRSRRRRRRRRRLRRIFVGASCEARPRESRRDFVARKKARSQTVLSSNKTFRLPFLTLRIIHLFFLMSLLSVTSTMTVRAFFRHVHFTKFRTVSKPPSSLLPRIRLKNWRDGATTVTTCVWRAVCIK